MALTLNNHVFKGHRTLLGNKFVTYGELELPLRSELYDKSKNGFDWGNSGKSANQLAFSILYQLSNQEVALECVEKFTNEVIKTLNSRDWVMSAQEVLRWIEKNSINFTQKIDINSQKEMLKEPKPAPKRAKKTNVVKEVCKELGITQKNLAEILEVPEGTISSWAVKNEIPRLGKKAIEFYIENSKNKKIVESYKAFVTLIEKH